MPDYDKLEDYDITGIMYDGAFDERVVSAIHDIANAVLMSSDEWGGFHIWCENNFPFNPAEIKTAADLVLRWERSCAAEFEDEDEDEPSVKWEELTPDEVELVERYRSEKFKEYLR